MDTPDNNMLTDLQCEEIIGFYGVRRRIERTRNKVYLAALCVFGALLMHVQSGAAPVAWWHITLGMMAVVFVLAYEAVMRSVLTGGQHHLINCGLPEELVQSISTNNIAVMDKRLAAWSTQH